jgi:hypothetical protein
MEHSNGHNRFRQVLFNLLSNAIKFTPDFGSVCVRLYNDLAALEEVVASVTDTGIGIKQESLQQLFAVRLGFSHLCLLGVMRLIAHIVCVCVCVCMYVCVCAFSLSRSWTHQSAASMAVQASAWPSADSCALPWGARLSARAKLTKAPHSRTYDHCRPASLSNAEQRVHVRADAGLLFLWKRRSTARRTP